MTMARLTVPERLLLSKQLLAATSQGDVKAMKDALTRGADVTYTDGMGNTPLMMAALYWHTEGDFREGVRMLIEAHVPLNTMNKDGHTALMRAAIFGLDEMVGMLLGVGADPKMKSHKGYTAEVLAARSFHPEVSAKFMIYKRRQSLRAKPNSHFRPH